jgi:hypothetical protein
MQHRCSLHSAGQARSGSHRVRKTHQYWREGREPRSLRRLRDSGGRHLTAFIHRNPASHRGTAAAACACVKRSIVTHSVNRAFYQNHGESASKSQPVRHFSARSTQNPRYDFCSRKLFGLEGESSALFVSRSGRRRCAMPCDDGFDRIPGLFGAFWPRLHRTNKLAPAKARMPHS